MSNRPHVISIAMVRFLRILFMSCVILECKALYFFLKGNGEKCFYRELPAETLLLANYRCSPLEKPLQPELQKCGILVRIKDPKDHVVLSRLYHHEGRFSYKSHDPGMHSICLRTNATSRFKAKYRIDFDLQVGQRALNASTFNRRLHLTGLEARYRQLLDLATDIEKEIDYLRYREELFRDTTETISRRVYLWMVVETILVVIVGVWQYENFRRHFDSKKLI